MTAFLLSTARIIKVLCQPRAGLVCAGLTNIRSHEWAGRNCQNISNFHTYQILILPLTIPQLCGIINWGKHNCQNIMNCLNFLQCIQYTNIRSWTNTRSEFDLKCQILRELRQPQGAAFGCTGAALGSCKRSCDYAPRGELRFKGAAPRKFDKKFQVLIKNF